MMMMEEFLLKTEKPNNFISRYNLFTTLSKTLRFIELCILLLLLSWLLTRLPFAFSLSAQFLRRLATFAATPLFVFALSNAIIVSLLAQSRHSSSDHSADLLYNNLLNSRHAPPSQPHAPPPTPPRASDEEFHDKQVIAETVKDIIPPAADAGALATFRRSKSEKWKGEVAKTPRRKQLRRVETEKRHEDSPEILYPQDKLSNEEFQRTIEAFIAKQLRFLKEESSAIVVRNSS